MRLLESFILNVPYIFLKKIPYAWVFVVFFWSWPPVISGIFLAIVLLGLLMMVWQQRAWENRIRREFSSGGASPFIDRPHIARTIQIRNLLLVCMAGGLLGWLLNGRIGMGGLQWSLLSAGFMLLYRDVILFGRPVTYILTDQGIGIRFAPGHVDYRMFFKYHEIWRAAGIKVPEHIPLRWDVLTPQRYPKEGVLLSAVRREGFSKQIQSEVLLRPTDIEEFLGKLAGHVTVVEEGLFTTKGHEGTQSK